MYRQAGPLFMFVALLTMGFGCAYEIKDRVARTPEMTKGTPFSEKQTPVMFSNSEPSIINNAGPSLDRKSITTVTEHTSIIEGDVYDVLVVKGKHVSLEVSGGQINELIVKNENQVSMAGGTIEAMYLYDNCLAEISGGSINTVFGYGHNTVSLKGKGQIGTLASYGETQVIVDSNDAGLGTLQYFTKCGCVDQSQRASLKLSGGRFRNIGTGLSDVLLTVTGYDLSKSAYGGTYGFGMVKGHWKHGADFSINLMDKFTFSHTDLNTLSSASDREAGQSSK